MKQMEKEINEIKINNNKNKLLLKNYVNNAQ